MGWGKKGEISLLNVALVVKVETSLYDRGFMTLPPMSSPMILHQKCNKGICSTYCQFYSSTRLFPFKWYFPKISEYNFEFFRQILAKALHISPTARFANPFCSNLSGKLSITFRKHWKTPFSRQKSQVSLQKPAMC